MTPGMRAPPEESKTLLPAKGPEPVGQSGRGSSETSGTVGRRRGTEGEGEARVGKVRGFEGVLMT